MPHHNYQLKLNQLTDRQRKTYDQVSFLYSQTSKRISYWLWEQHVQTVAYFALELAKKYSADADVCFSAALLHDIADVWLERDDPAFAPKTKQTSQDVLNKAGFPQEVWVHLYTRVIEPHSCRPGNMPNNLESKILATADAMAHLRTNFYLDFQEMGVPTNDPIEFKRWVHEKLDRDFGRKMFFDEEKESVKDRYLELKKHFR